MYLEINPLFSILFSLLIINGFYNITNIVSRSAYLSFLGNNIIQKKIILFFLITNFISVLFYNLFLLSGIHKLFLQVIIVSIIIFGFYKPFNIKDLKKYIKLINHPTKYLLALLIFGYFLISLLPVTDPDSLDYHLTVPYLSLLNEEFYIQKEWFHSQLVGAGEAMIILGASINAYKLSSLLQFTSLFLIIISILNLKLKKNIFSIEAKTLICISILCIPSFLYLTFTAKPQLFSIGTNYIAFLITFFILPYEKNTKNLIIIFSIISFLCLCSTQFKFSFFLSSGIILIFAFYEMIKKKCLIKSLLISILFFIILVVPREYFDYSNLSNDIIKNFFQPVTDDFLSEYVVNSLRHGTGNPRYFPYWIFVPYYLGEIRLGVITEIIGFSALVFLVNFRIKRVHKIVFAAVIFFILAIPFGQPTGRFFIEPFLWLMTGSVYYLTIQRNFLLSIYKKLIIINSIGILCVIIFTSVNFLPGIFSKESHKNILKKYADGYKLYDWANTNLPTDSIILTSHRSSLFSKNKFVSYEFRLYASNQNELEYYIDIINKKKVTHVLYSGIDWNVQTDVLQKCRGELAYKANGIQPKTTRNPFNQKNINYDGFIYQIDLEKLTQCEKYFN